MTELLNTVVDKIISFINFLQDIFDFIHCLITFIPQPFRNIFLSYLGIITIFLIVKGVRGE